MDGPGAERDFYVQRSPLFLRVVEDRQGKWNVLDLVNDEPTKEEEIFVYRRVSVEHRCYRGADRNKSGMHCNYVHVNIETSQKASLRYTERWREWASVQTEQPA